MPAEVGANPPGDIAPGPCNLRAEIIAGNIQFAQCIAVELDGDMRQIRPSHCRVNFNLLV